jgi:hypothetical protein
VDRNPEAGGMATPRGCGCWRGYAELGIDSRVGKMIRRVDGVVEGATHRAHVRLGRLAGRG